MLKTSLWFRRPSIEVEFYQDIDNKSEDYQLWKRKFWQWASNSDVFKSENVHVFESEGGLVRNVVQYFEDREEFETFNLELKKLIREEPFNGISPQEHPDFVKYNEENGITTNFNQDSSGPIEV